MILTLKRQKESFQLLRWDGNMKRVIFRIIRKLLSYLYGKYNSQELFEGLKQIGILGMNYAYPEDVNKNGEAFTIRYIRTKLPKNPVIFDVGANIGMYSKIILSEFGQDLKLFSFEPSADTFNQLQKSVTDSRVSLYQLGIGDKIENRILYSHSDFSGISSVYNRELRHSNLSYSSNEEIKMVTLDNFWKENEINRNDYLKLDLEGNELFALKGAIQLLNNNCIRFIQFEFGGGNIDSKTFFRDFWYLLNEKYHIYRIVSDGLRKIDKYDEYCEVFITINYLAELKTAI